MRVFFLGTVNAQIPVALQVAWLKCLVGGGAPRGRRAQASQEAQQRQGVRAAGAAQTRGNQGSLRFALATGITEVPQKPVYGSKRGAADPLSMIARDNGESAVYFQFAIYLADPREEGSAP